MIDNPEKRILSIKEKIARLLSQYKTFKVYTLKELASDIFIGDNIRPAENSIYVPRSGRIIQSQYENLKSHNYYQIILKPNLAIAAYLKLFFDTDVGKNIFELINTGNYVPSNKRANVENLEIPLPTLEIQNGIVNLIEKLSDLKDKLSQFEQELAVNPLSCQTISGDVNKLLDTLDLLNDSEKILAMIREGESKMLEFKETLSKNIKNSEMMQRDKDLEMKVLRTIVAFLNTDGGTLLIGVNDRGAVTGIEQDFFKDNDSYLLHLQNLIRDYIGAEFFPLVNYKIVQIQDKSIVRIDCNKNESEVFLKNDDKLYVRSTPATVWLTGPQMIAYIKNHFGKSQMK